MSNPKPPSGFLAWLRRQFIEGEDQRQAIQARPPQTLEDSLQVLAGQPSIRGVARRDLGTYNPKFDRLNVARPDILGGGKSVPWEPAKQSYQSSLIHEYGHKLDYKNINTFNQLRRQLPETSNLSTEEFADSFLSAVQELRGKPAAPPGLVLTNSQGDMYENKVFSDTAAARALKSWLLKQPLYENYQPPKKKSR